MHVVGAGEEAVCNRPALEGTREGAVRHRALISVDLEARVHGVPVDHVPPRGDVVGAAVLVLQVVGVLPHVDAEHGVLALHDRRVLVGRARRARRRRRSLTSQAQPLPKRPTPALANCFLERVEAAERRVDGVGDLPVGAPPALGAISCPEQRVVHVPAAVVAHGRADVLGDRVEIGDQLARSACPAAPGACRARR